MTFALAPSHRLTGTSTGSHSHQHTNDLVMMDQAQLLKMTGILIWFLQKISIYLFLFIVITDQGG